MSYPMYLLKHQVTYDVFPEFWDLVVDKLEAEGDKISTEQFYLVVGQLDECGIDDKNSKVWSVVRALFEKHCALRKLDVESALKMRNIVLRRLPDDTELVLRLEAENVAMLMDFSMFKMARLCRLDSDLIPSYHEQKYRINQRLAAQN